MPDENEPGAEKRKFKRIDRHFMARLQTGPEENWQTIFLRDLGAGGVLFTHHAELRTGEEIRLSITFPMSKEPILCSALVVRSKLREVPVKFYEVAACFIEADETQQELINRAAEIYSSKKNKPGSDE